MVPCFTRVTVETLATLKSSYIMLEQRFEQRKAVSSLGIEHGRIYTLLIAERELAERVVTILKPFYAATVEIPCDHARWLG
jgi:hypothetical protein